MQQMLHVFKQWTFPLNAQSYEALRWCSNMGLFHSANDEWRPYPQPPASPVSVCRNGAFYNIISGKKKLLYYEENMFTNLDFCAIPTQYLPFAAAKFWTQTEVIFVFTKAQSP